MSPFQPTSVAGTRDDAMLALFALGIGIGLTLALTGAGGSIIAVPILMFGVSKRSTARCWLARSPPCAA